MALSIVTPPSGSVVSLQEAAEQCRVDVADENVLMNGLIEAAVEFVESYTNRALLTQTWDLKLDSFFSDGYYDCGAIRLPKPPVSSVTSVTYTDSAGVSQTWSASLWNEDLPAGPKALRARIFPAYGQSWPTTRCEPNAAVIRFVCGYGTPDDVPYSIKAALLLLIGHWFANRESVTPQSMTELPMGVEALLAGFVAC